MRTLKSLAIALAVAASSFLTGCVIAPPAGGANVQYQNRHGAAAVTFGAPQQRYVQQQPVFIQQQPSWLGLRPQRLCQPPMAYDNYRRTWVSGPPFPC